MLDRLAETSGDLQGFGTEPGLGPRVADQFPHDLEDHRRVLRLQRHHLLEVLHGLAELALPPKDLGQAVVREKIVGLEFQGDFKLCHCPLEIASWLENVGHRAVAFGQVGVEFQRGAALDQGVIIAALDPQDFRQVVVGEHVLGVIGDRDTKLVNGLFAPA